MAAVDLAACLAARTELGRSRIRGGGAGGRVGAGWLVESLLDLAVTGHKGGEGESETAAASGATEPGAKATPAAGARAARAATRCK